MPDTKDIVILNGNVSVKSLPTTTYPWAGPVDGDRDLGFKRAYEICAEDWNKGIVDCVYSIHGRKFQDLSCMEGKILQKFQDRYQDGYEVREHTDGTKFIFSCGIIPTFDSGDREWDSVGEIAIYADTEGIDLIHCNHGYKIPRIKVYIGLTRSTPAFTELLKYLGV